MTWFRRHYGAGPLHLVALVASFAVAAYAVTKVFAQGGWAAILLWFVACVVVHDLIGWPLYTAIDRLLLRTARRRSARRAALARRAATVPWVNHVRVPAVISGVLLGIAFPLIFRLSQQGYEASTGFDENVYVLHWLVATAVISSVSALAYLLRISRARRRVAQ